MVIRRLVNKKISKIRGLMSLSVLAAMFVIFFLFIPKFIGSTAGQIFVAIWGLMAILSFVAHGRGIKNREGRQYVPLYGVKKAEHTSLKVRSTSRVRGL